MRQLNPLLPSLLLIFCAFYVLPFFGRDTGTFMLILLFITPGICLAASFMAGYRAGFAILFPILVGLMFAPTLPIFYNATAWVYIVIYGMVAVLGMSLGSQMKKSKA